MRANLSYLRRIPGAGRWLRAVGISGVPAVGYFGAGWPIGTMLVLYWIETVLVTLSVVVIARRHRKATNDPGHRDGWRTTFAAGFLRFMIPFNVFHGLFIAVYAFLAFPRILGPSTEVSASSLATGALAITLCLGFGLHFDLRKVGERSFDWVQRHAHHAGGRMVVTHLTLLFGVAPALSAENPLPLLAVFVGLKAVADLVAIVMERGAKE